VINQTVFQLMERTGLSYEEATDMLWSAAEEENDRRIDDECVERLARFYGPQQDYHTYC
jgi:hypothetical protein